jgi:hypothetical protein
MTPERATEEEIREKERDLAMILRARAPPG